MAASGSISNSQKYEVREPSSSSTCEKCAKGFEGRAYQLLENTGQQLFHLECLGLPPILDETKRKVVVLSGRIDGSNINIGDPDPEDAEFIQFAKETGKTLRGQSF